MRIIILVSRKWGCGIWEEYLFVEWLCGNRILGFEDKVDKINYDGKVNGKFRKIYEK